MLGLAPGTQCDFGVCAPISGGFLGGAAAGGIAIGTGICVVAEPCGAAELLALLIGTASLPAAEAEKEAKAGADAQTRAEAKKPAVRIIVLKGTYADFPSASDMDPMSFLLGGLEKPGSFFEVCRSIGRFRGKEGGSLTAWIKRIAASKALIKLRAAKYRDTDALDDADGGVIVGAGDRDVGLQLDLEQALARLSDTSRAVGSHRI